MDGLAHAAVAAEPPDIELSQLERAVQKQFGLRGNYTPLISERDQNFRLMTTSGDEYIVKVTSSVEPAIVSEFQVAALLHLEMRGVTAPRVVRTRDGSVSGKVRAEHRDLQLRLVRYLPGVQLASVPINRDMAFDVGTRLAQLDVALQSFSHPGDQPVLLWDMQRAGELRELLSHIDDTLARQAVERALDDYRSAVVPELGELRAQVIHGDANPGNILVDPSSRRVVGFIDFGDMVRAPLVFDVAIAAAYLRRDDSSPLQLIAPLIAGYSSIASLQEREIALLFDLVRVRLATTITLLFWRLAARDANDPYRQKTLCEEAGAMRFLGALDAHGRAEFERHIASAV